MNKTLSQWLQAGHSPQELIGKQVLYTRKYYEIIDVLQDDHALVLSSEDHEQVQDDSYGRAHRLVPETALIHFCDEHGVLAHVCHDITLIATKN
ncbi:MAG: hypothetical protein Q9M22_01795 [Mariprofundaceae bacterium]|nr:hypothetical protein [Mariprofundaceae bacterium]